MTANNQLVVSARDAEALASVFTDRHLAVRFDNEMDALADLLTGARRVPHEDLPRNRVAINSRVTYREADGPARTITLVHPAAADAAKLRVSVLSPLGCALLGRRPGSSVKTSLSGGRGVTLHIIEVQGAR